MATTGLAPEAENLIAALGLEPHPEGGFYREIYRASLKLDGLPHGGPRHAATGIYFLLPAGAHSAWHRVRSDEVWHHYQGDPVELHLIDAEGRYIRRLLGQDIAGGQEPQICVPADIWQAARPCGDRFALCGCTVSPGFDFADFAMPTGEILVSLFPELADTIRPLAKSID